MKIFDCFSSPFDQTGDYNCSFFPKYDKYFNSYGKYKDCIIYKDSISTYNCYPNIDIYK